MLTQKINTKLALYCMQVPTNGPRGYPDNYTLANATTTTPVCEQCGDKNKPVEYSDTCSEYLCEVGVFESPQKT